MCRRSPDRRAGRQRNIRGQSPGLFAWTQACPNVAVVADALLPSDAGEEQRYQSLYRRYRPQRFAEVRGQDHVTGALRNSVRQARVAHAYLFSGPRGTGKTSTARILAMALNCEQPIDGEPDGTCHSCVEIRRGASLDVHELDAASNRKLDEMRDLLSRVALGTRGRWKVYIIDEVHQLTGDAASALLKTLEEPPGHVVFVLATTDPQKVLPTIRSRTQHFEFRLLSSGVLGELLKDVNIQASLGIPPEAIDLVVRRGHGSARDALSVLDQVAAAGGVDDDVPVVADIVDAVADRDPQRVLVAVAEAMSAGRDPRRLTADLLDHLRNGFLASQARGLLLLPDDAAAVVEDQARRLGLARLVRAMEAVGTASTEMRDSVDPRVTLEVALVRLASSLVDTDPGALLERIERLEARLAGASAGGPSPALSALAGASATSPAGASPADADRRGPGERSAVEATAPVTPSVGPGRRPTRPTSEAAPEGGGTVPPPPPLPSRGTIGSQRRARQPATDRPGSPATDRPGSPPPPGPPAPDGPGSPAPDRPGPPPGSPATDRPGSPPPPGPPAPDGPGSPAPDRPGPPPGSPPPPGLGAPAAPAVAPATEERSAGPEPPGATAPARTASPGSLPSRDDLTKAWGDAVLAGLRPGVKAYLAPGRFVAVDAVAAVFALPDQGLIARAQPVRGEAEAALAAHFGRPVPLRLVLDDGASPARRDAPAPEPDDPSAFDPSAFDLDQLEDAGAGLSSPEQRLLEAFPGAEEVVP